MMMVIGGPKGDDEKPSFGQDKEESEDTGPSLSGLAEKKAAKNILAAIEGSDPVALSKALKAHYDACQGDDEAEEATE